MIKSGKCPCGQTEAYENCCSPLHRGEEKAKTAEQLMRSRYTAFCKGEIDYLIETLHFSKRSETDRQSLQNTASNCQWLKLHIHSTEGGTAEDDNGFVEFSAYYQEKELGVLTEKSRVLGAWILYSGNIFK